MAQWCAHWGVEVWAYCLMPTYVHLIAVPPSEDALSHAIGEAHRRYTRRVNFLEGWRGHLWQGRFASFPMDKAYLKLCMVAPRNYRRELFWISWPFCFQCGFPFLFFLFSFLSYQIFLKFKCVR